MSYILNGLMNAIQRVVISAESTPSTGQSTSAEQSAVDVTSETTMNPSPSPSAVSAPIPIPWNNSTIRSRRASVFSPSDDEQSESGSTDSLPLSLGTYNSSLQVTQATSGPILTTQMIRQKFIPRLYKPELAAYPYISVYAIECRLRPELSHADVFNQFNNRLAKTKSVEERHEQWTGVLREIDRFTKLYTIPKNEMVLRKFTTSELPDLRLLGVLVSRLLYLIENRHCILTYCTEPIQTQFLLNVYGGVVSMGLYLAAFARNELETRIPHELALDVVEPHWRWMIPGVNYMYTYADFAVDEPEFFLNMKPSLLHDARFESVCKCLIAYFEQAMPIVSEALQKRTLKALTDPTFSAVSSNLPYPYVDLKETKYYEVPTYSIDTIRHTLMMKRHVPAHMKKLVNDQFYFFATLLQEHGGNLDGLKYLDLPTIQFSRLKAFLFGVSILTQDETFDAEVFHAVIVSNFDKIVVIEYLVEYIGYMELARCTNNESLQVHANKQLVIEANHEATLLDQNTALSICASLASMPPALTPPSTPHPQPAARARSVSPQLPFSAASPPPLPFATIVRARSASPSPLVRENNISGPLVGTSPPRLARASRASKRKANAFIQRYANDIKRRHVTSPVVDSAASAAIPAASEAFRTPPRPITRPHTLTWAPARQLRSAGELFSGP